MTTIRYLLVAVIMTVAVSMAYANAAGPFLWTKVGGDPCRPTSGCTLEWALGKSAWPAEVVDGLLRLVKTVSPETVEVTSGWRGWMTWGAHVRKFHADTLAAWPEGQREPASRWSFDHGDRRYVLLKIHKCGNWGGATETVDEPLPEPFVGLIPLGTIPVGSCPE